MVVKPFSGRDSGMEDVWIRIEVMPVVGMLGVKVELCSDPRASGYM